MIANVTCPAHRPGIAALTTRTPAVLLPILGRNLLDRRLSELFTQGQRRISLTAADRPELVREFLRCGEPWGLEADLIPVAEEAPPAEDRELLDGLSSSGESAFKNYRGWFETIRAAFRSSDAPRMGMREVAKDVWVHLRAKVHATAQLTGPCWIGERAYVGAEAALGPHAYVEDGCFIERSAHVRESWIGPSTYVGAFTEVLESLAWGKMLCKWTTGDVTEVADSFLLSELRPAAPSSISLLARAAAAATALLTAPIVPLALAASLVRRRPLWELREAVLPDGNTVKYMELAGLRGGWRRWPRLLAIARGRFAWFGNPPLSPQEAAQLDGEFERMWLQVPPGLFTMAAAMGCGEAPADETKAHAGYYAACRSRRLNLDIIRRLFVRALSDAVAIFARRKPLTNEHLCLRPNPSSK